MREDKDCFHFNKHQYASTIFPDKADVSRSRACEREANQPSVGTSSTGHGLHLSARGKGLTGTQGGKSLEDGTERGEGGMTRSIFFWGRVEKWVGFKDT